MVLNWYYMSSNLVKRQKFANAFDGEGARRIERVDALQIQDQ